MLSGAPGRRPLRRERVEQETAAGRDGSTAVTAACDDATAATEALREAEQSLGDAVQHVADTQTAANDRVVEAEDAVESRPSTT